MGVGALARYPEPSVIVPASSLLGCVTLDQSLNPSGPLSLAHRANVRIATRIASVQLCGHRSFLKSICSRIPEHPLARLPSPSSTPHSLQVFIKPEICPVMALFFQPLAPSGLDSLNLTLTPRSFHWVLCV